MPCTPYGDLGKPAKDIFNKGYHFGLFKFEWKNKARNDLQITATGENNHDTGKTQCSLQSEYKLKEYGLTVKEKWNTDNVLNTEITVEDQFVDGLKLTFDAMFAPITRKKAAKLKSVYKHDAFHVNMDVDLNYQGPVVNAASVVHYVGWVAGYQMSFNSADKKLTKNNFACGYQNKELGLHAEVANGQELQGTMYRRVSDEVEGAVMASYSQANSAAKAAIACKYDMDDLTTIRAKVNNSGQLGVGFQRQLNKGIKFTLSALFNTAQLNQGQHKVGCALEFDN